MARWAKPCNICGGKTKVACMFCGWKRKDDRATSAMDQAAIRGKRARTDFLFNLDRMSTKAHNASSGDDSIDLEIIKHRDWAEKIYSRHVDDGESIKSIAESEELNPGLVQRIINLMKGKLVRHELDGAPMGPIPGERGQKRWLKEGQNVSPVQDA